MRASRSATLPSTCARPPPAVRPSPSRASPISTSPAFASLRGWLSSSAVSLEDLQTRLDEVFKQVRTATLAPTPPPAGGSPPEDGGVT